MKKLLSLLATTTLCFGATATVISCKKEKKDIDRDKNIKYNSDLIKQLVIEINGILNGINMGDIVKNSELLDLVVKKIDESIGLQNFFDTTNANLSQIKNVIEKETKTWDNVNDFRNEYNKLSDSATRNKLFSEYTRSISNKSPLDYSQIEKGYSFNIQNEVKIDNHDIEPGSYIKFKDGENWKRWVINGEIIENGETWINDANLPSIEILTKEFKEDSKEKLNFKICKDGKKEEYLVSSSVALSLRFQDYFDNKLKSDSIVNALTMSHNLSNLFTISNRSTQINILNTVAKSTTKWSESNFNEFNTNVKMVWTLQFDKNKLTNTNIEKILNGLKDEKEKILDDNFILNKEKSIKDIFNYFNKEEFKDKLVTQKENQYDPYFGLEGYKGISFIENGSSFGIDILDGKKYSEEVKKYDKRGGIIIQDGTNYGFPDENDPSKINVPIVLPIYLIQLLGGSENVKDNMKIKDARNEIVANIDLHKYGKYWNSETNKKLHSIDIQSIAKDETLQKNLLTEIVYMISLNVKNQDESKYATYPKYLDKWHIYNDQLWQRIGKYIGDFKNEDM